MQKFNGNILIVDDDEDVLLTTKIVLKKHFKNIRTESNPQLVHQILNESFYDVVLLDMNFAIGATSGKEGFLWLDKIKKYSPHSNIVMITAYGDIDLAVKAMKEGATDFIIKPWDNKKLAATVISAYNLTQSNKTINRLKEKQNTLINDIDRPFKEIIGQSGSITEVFATIEKIGKTDANVLITGENGTGKELVARALHRKSSRFDQVFIKVDLGAIPETLFESELFGHVKGAFTGANESRVGRFEVASGGTLFLDEIGNLSLSLQSKLLSVIQNRTVTRIGANKNVPIDIRLICATNIPPSDLKSEKKFRQDLLYRINTVEISIPPLRERVSDIPLLAGHFLQIYRKKYNKETKNISSEALRKLKKYQWPGNVRELKHVIERAVIMSDGLILKPSDFVLHDFDYIKPKAKNLNLEQIEKNTITMALHKHNGNLSSVAKDLGIGRTTLYRKMNKYGL